MTEHEVDDVAFLTGESGNVNKRSMYERDRIAVCSQKRAMAVALFVFIILFMIAVLIAFATPLNGCSFFPGTSGVFNDSEDDSSRLFIATNGEEFPHKDARLPNHTLPRHYTISIHPNLTTLEVVGWVVIQFVVTQETHFIVLHSKKLRIIEKWLKEEIDGKPQEPHNISKFLEYEENQQIYLEVESPLYPDKSYSLGIRFQTNISRELEGFYLSSYVDSKGEKRLLATTHFEPTYARSAFPCFDEPQYKATFKMIIIRDRQHKSLFNMPIKKIETVYYGYNIELWRDEFHESVEMSTYLVAFVVCDYNSTEATTRKNVKVSIHTPENLVNQSVFALDSAVQLMDYYDDFFGVPYPLPKQDLIAIPDFGAGAMENWGLITYRETSILYDSTESSSTAHQWVAVVVAHELAHQWFGNLVTMKWWKDLWLNEGFASFVEYVGVDHIKPDWKMMEQFVLEKTQPALALDALDNSHPISVEVVDPREIEAIFDTISYSKGAAILYMLKTVLGQDVLRQGLMHYLNENKFKNAETDDFWRSLSQSTNGTLQVKSIMDTWTQQMGFPLVTVRIDNQTVRASQRRFLMSPPDVNQTLPIDANPGFDYKPTPAPENEYQWYIPLTYTTDVRQNMEYVWMNKSEHEFSLTYRPEWIKFNVNQTGFYRVHYEPKLWAALMRVLKNNPSAFTPTDRANLIDDAFTLCKAGLVGAEVPLELTQYLSKETEYVPWATALEHFRAWSKVLFDSPAHRMLLKYVDKLIGPVVKFVGWNDSGSHLVKLLRSDILYSAIHVENEAAVKEANSRFNNWRSKGTAVPPNLREVVYSAGVKYGGAVAWDHCWARYNRTQVPSERKLLLKALGAARNPWLLQQYLVACLDRDKIRPQDVRTVLPVVAANPAGRLLAWRHLRAHWSHYQTVFGQGSFTMGGLITSVVAHFSNEFDYEEVSTYFTDLDVGSGARALNQSLEMIRLNIRWLQANEQALISWLDQNVR